MANYNVLKTAIQTAVDWDNNDNQISGNDILAILLSIINNTVSVGYLFVGVATPATNPGTPDQNVFYLASTAGTYSNFGGIEVTDKVAIIKGTGSVWSAEYTEIDLGLGDEIDAILTILNGGSTETPITLTETYGLITPAGVYDPTSPSIWSTSQEISLPKGDTIKLTAYGTSGAAAISIKSGNTYTMPSGCTWPTASKTQASFQYTATENCVVVLCYRNDESGTNPRSASIVHVTNGLINEIAEKIDDVAIADGKIYGRMRGVWVELSQLTDKTLTQPDVPADAKAVGDILLGKAAETEFHTIDISIIQGAVILNTGEESTGSPYWSRTVAYKLKAGDTIRLNGAGIASTSAIARVNSNGTFTPLVLYTGTSATQQQLDYQATEECYVTLSFRNSPFTHAFSIKLAATQGLVKDVEDLEEQVKIDRANIVITNVIEVGPGLTFTSLIAAVASISDASYNNQYEIHLMPGTYDTVDASQIVEGGNYKGLEIPDYVSIKGIGDRDSIIIRGQVTAETASHYSAETINKISAINMMLNGKLENVTLLGKNVRYCNHNDGSHTVFVKQVFRDVAFVYDILEITGVAANCNGIGNECGKDILFDHCIFDNKNNNGGCLFFHDNAAASQKQGARMEIRNCIFKGGSVALSNSGGSMECWAIIINTKLWGDILMTSSNVSITTNRWKVLASSNLNFGYTQSSGMSGLDLSGDITAFCNGN